MEVEVEGSTVLADLCNHYSFDYFLVDEAETKMKCYLSEELNLVDTIFGFEI